MQDSEKKAFIGLLTAISDLVHQPLSQSAQGLYWAILKEFSLQDIQRATEHILKTRKYSNFPQPAEFVEFICPPEELDFKAAKGARSIYDHACNPYPSFVFDDPVCARVALHLGGWQRVHEQLYAHKSEDDLRWWIKDLERLYRMFAKHPLPKENPRMIGRNEASNIEKGYLTDDSGGAIEGSGGEYLRIGSPEALKYLEAQKNKLIPADPRGQE